MKLLSFNNAAILAESAIICLLTLDTSLSNVLTLGTISLTGVWFPDLSFLNASSVVVPASILYAPGKMFSS